MRHYPIIASLALLAVFSACRKQDEVYREFIKDGTIVYAHRADSARAYSGNKRIKITWLRGPDPNVTHAIIYWNSRQDSLEVTIPAGQPTDTVAVLLENLSEGSHTFEVVTIDNKGNRSVTVDFLGTVYGDLYLSSVRPKTLSGFYYVDGAVYMTWTGGGEDLVGQEVRFKNSADQEVSVLISRETDTLQLPDYQSGTPVHYRSLFRPDSLVIDTFYSEFETATLQIVLAEDQPLNPDRFRPYVLPGDAPDWTGSGNAMSNLWSGVLAGSADNKAWYRTNNGSGIPHHFQFDLGVRTRLTGLRIWQRGTVNEHNLLYANGNLKRWEIWGSTDPAPDGSDDGWVKLLDCESLKPSGLPLGELTEEDIAYAQEGEYFNFPEDSPEIRYLRIRVLETWGGTDYMFTSQLDLHGSYWQGVQE